LTPQYLKPLKGILKRNLDWEQANLQSKGCFSGLQVIAVSNLHWHHDDIFLL